MKTTITVLSVLCAVIAYYFGLRYFTGRDLGFTPAKKYVRSFLETLLHTEVTAAHEANTTPATTAE